MIGEQSITAASPGRPMSTGKRPSLSHASTYPRAHWGGSSSETKAPSATRSSRCAATAARRSQSGRVAPGRPPAVVTLPTSIRTSATPYGEGGRSRRLDGHAEPARACGPADRRPRRPSSRSSAHPRSAPTRVGCRCRRPAGPQGGLPFDASSQGTCVVSCVSSRGTSTNPSAVVASTRRRWTCRQRTRPRGGRDAHRRPRWRGSTAAPSHRARPRPRASARPTGSAPGSWPSWLGRGRGRTPRRGPRRPPPVLRRARSHSPASLSSRSTVSSQPDSCWRVRYAESRPNVCRSRRNQA